MTSSNPPGSVVSRITRIIRAELANYPGRAALVARIVLACTAVMVLVMVFRIPGAALGAYYPLLLSRESPQATRKSALRIGVACTLGAAEILLGGMLSAGSPLVHFLWVLANLFAVFYMISGLKFLDAAMAAGVQIAIAIAAWDEPVSGELRVEHTLYTLLSILMACIISALIETIFAKKHPPDAVISGIRQRLGLVKELLQKGTAPALEVEALGIQLNRYATRGTGDLRQLLAHANYEDTYQEQVSTVIALTGQLVESSVSLVESIDTLSAVDIARCSALGGSVERICNSLQLGDAPDWIDLSQEHEVTSPILIEIERTIDLIAQSFTGEGLPIHHHLPVANAVPDKGIFVNNAFQSNEHFKFAVRGTLSALFCYLFYMTTGWMALGGSITTCFLTALPHTGASRHKQTLRFAGFLIGACVLGLGAEVLILPKIDDLLEFTLLFACVVSIGAWVATSGPRIAYLGFQIVLAYDLVNLNRFTINTSLVPARDAILGIILAIFAMWLFFDHLWAKSSTVTLRSLLLSTLREVAWLDRTEAPSAKDANQRLAAESIRINRNLDKLRSLSDLYAFESYPKTREDGFLDRFVKTLLPQVRTFLLVKHGLLQHSLVGELETEKELISEVRLYSSEVLLKVANSVEQLSPQQSGDTRARHNELCTRVKSEIARGLEGGERGVITEMRLCSSLLDLAFHVEAGVEANLAAG